MTITELAQLNEHFAALYPNQYVSIEVEAVRYGFNPFSKEARKTQIKYSVYVEGLFNEDFDTETELIMFITEVHNKSKNKVEILKEVAKKQVEDYKAKNRIKEF